MVLEVATCMLFEEGMKAFEGFWFYLPTDVETLSDVGEKGPGQEALLHLGDGFRAMSNLEEEDRRLSGRKELKNFAGEL